MTLGSVGIASAVFLALYALCFAYLFVNYATRRFVFKSRWSLICFHVLVRLGAQCVGIAFAEQSSLSIGLLVAFLVLSAEGYFSLMLCALRILISWQKQFSSSHQAWVEKSLLHIKETDTQKRSEKVLAKVFFTPAGLVHLVMIAGNILIIVGGSQLAGNTLTQQQYEHAKNLRGAGQIIFLVLMVIISAFIVGAYAQARKKTASSGMQENRAELLILVATIPFLLVRGSFGVAQAFDNSLSYFNSANYDSQGFKEDFVIKEYILATTMEWISCALMLSTSLLRANEYKDGKTMSATSKA